MCLFPQDLKNINHIFDDHVGSYMTKEEFRQLGKADWEKQHGFVIIDLSSKKHNGKNRSGLDDFIYKIKLKIKTNIIFSLQIVNTTEPKRSFSIVVSDNKTRVKTWFKPPIQLDKKKDYEISSSIWRRIFQI